MHIWRRSTRLSFAGERTFRATVNMQCRHRVSKDPSPLSVRLYITDLQMEDHHPGAISNRLVQVRAQALRQFFRIPLPYARPATLFGGEPHEDRFGASHLKRKYDFVIGTLPAAYVWSIKLTLAINPMPARHGLRRSGCLVAEIGISTISADVFCREKPG